MATINKNKLKNNEVKIGDGNPGDKKLSFDNGSTNPPYFEYDDTEKKLKYSETGLVQDEKSLASDSNFVFTQATPALVWNCTHNLNKFPSVIVVDSAGTVVYPSITYIDNNTVQITHNYVMSGKVYFN